uniref:Transcription initiation factor IIA gamma chain n=1 Tax=Canis lupus dingo TaxID=286419 RepID=A0A8C0QZ93_CANLU
MTYQLYRNTTLGNSLQESLDENKSISGGSLNTNRFCNNVWTFVLNDVEFREVTELIKWIKSGSLGCDPGDPGSNPTSGSRCMETASPICLCLCLSLSLCDYRR